MGKLFMQALSKFLLGLVAVGILVFVPAGTVCYPGGVLLMGVLFVPMFAVGAALFLSMPLVLGSAAAFAVFLSYFPLIAARIRDEEQLLEQELEGYAAYKNRVRYRLVPFIW